MVKLTEKIENELNSKGLRPMHRSGRAPRGQTNRNFEKDENVVILQSLRPAESFGLALWGQTDQKYDGDGRFVFRAPVSTDFFHFSCA